MLALGADGPGVPSRVGGVAGGVGRAEGGPPIEKLALPTGPTGAPPALAPPPLASETDEPDRGPLAGVDGDGTRC